MVPHLNNKQNKNANPVIRQYYHLTQPGPSEQKQTNNNSAQISPYWKLTETPGPSLGGQKPKGRKNSTLTLGKGDLKYNKLKKNNEKADKYYTNEGTN